MKALPKLLHISLSERSLRVDVVFLPKFVLQLIERANVAHCSGGFAEAVLLRRRYAVMKEAARARRR